MLWNASIGRCRLNWLGREGESDALSGCYWLCHALVSLDSNLQVRVVGCTRWYTVRFTGKIIYRRYRSLDSDRFQRHRSRQVADQTLLPSGPVVAGVRDGAMTPLLFFTSMDSSHLPHVATGATAEFGSLTNNA